MESKLHTPKALTIAGSDSGGGAGIQADLKTFSALGVYGCSAITSLTAQNTLGVQDVLTIPPAFVQAQITSVLSDISVGAIKTGMLANADIVLAVIESLTQYHDIPLVVDPVMVSTSGSRLLEQEAIQTVVRLLIPRATLVTPNLLEAAALLDVPVAETVSQIRRQAEQLLTLGAKAILIKGGHAKGRNSDDLLMTDTGYEIFTASRILTKNTHGTGCTLAAAIAAGLAKKMTMSDAVTVAKTYLHDALAHADRLTIGKGFGPVHHFHKFY